MRNELRCKNGETEVGTKSDQNLATGQVLYQKHLGTAATLIKGGTQEAKFQRLLSLELHATQKRLDRPEGEEGGGTGTGHAGRRGVSARGEEPCHLRLRERSAGWRRVGAWQASQSSSRSPSSHRRHRRRTCCAAASRRLAPPRRSRRRTALGNISRSRHAGRLL